MNHIDPVAENAIIMAEKIGLVGEQGATIDGVTGLVNTAANDISSDASAGIPNIPPIDAVLLPAVSASKNVVLDIPSKESMMWSLTSGAMPLHSTIS